MGVIYKITSPTGRIYIGKTARLTERIRDYRWRGKKRKSIVNDSIKGYGWDAHKFEIIEECEDELLSVREIFWIKELNSYFLDNEKGMNMTRGGEKGGRSWMHDIERRKKQSERFSGEGGSFYGKKHTEEAKRIIGKKISEINKKVGRVVPKWGIEKGRLKNIVSILMYNANGAFIKEYESANLASRELKITRSCITDSLRDGSWVSGVYLFKYRTENYPMKIDVGEVKVKNEKRPVLTLSMDYDIICEHPSAKEASEFWGIPRGTINRAAMYNWLKPIRSGHVFIYTDLYAEIEKLTA